jgi:predicted nucleic acid-binding protein
MSLFALDSDTISLLQQGNATVVARIASRPAAEIAVPVIVVEEALSGWHSTVRRAKDSQQLARAYDRLAKSVSILSGIQILR